MSRYTVAALAAAVVGPAALASGQVRVVALTSDPIFGDYRRGEAWPTVISDTGDVLIHMRSPSSSGQSGSLFMAGVDGTLVPLAVYGQPGPVPDSTYTSISGTNGIDAIGRASFSASYRLAEGGWASAVLRGRPSDLEVIAQTGVVVDGMTFDHVTGFVRGNDAGEVTFTAGVTSANGSGTAIFSTSGGQPHLVAASGQPAPGTANDFGDLTSSWRVVGPDGSMLFDAPLAGVSGTASRALFRARPGEAPSLLLRGGDPVAGIAEAAYTDFYTGDFTSAGANVLANYNGTSGPGTQSFLINGPTRELLAQTGDAAPGGGTFTSLGHARMNDAGDLTFSASIGDPRNGVDTIFRRLSGESLERLVSKGDVISLAEGVQASVDWLYYHPHLSDNGVSIFELGFADPMTGEQLSDLRGFYAAKVDGTLVPLLRFGDDFEVAPGVSLANGPEFYDVAFVHGLAGGSVSVDGEFVLAAPLTNGYDAVLAIDVPSLVNLPGDANSDGMVSLADFLILRENFGTSGDGVLFVDGDFNKDGSVSLADFLILRENFGSGSNGAPLAPLPSAVPEPATAGLLAMMAGGLLIRRRR